MSAEAKLAALLLANRELLARLESAELRASRKRSLIDDRDELRAVTVQGASFHHDVFNARDALRDAIREAEERPSSSRLVCERLDAVIDQARESARDTVRRRAA